MQIDEGQPLPVRFLPATELPGFLTAAVEEVAADAWSRPAWPALARRSLHHAASELRRHGATAGEGCLITKRALFDLCGWLSAAAGALEASGASGDAADLVALEAQLIERIVVVSVTVAS